MPMEGSRHRFGITMKCGVSACRGACALLRIVISWGVESDWYFPIFGTSVTLHDLSSMYRARL
jgi:hypothetical protein